MIHAYKEMYLDDAMENLGEAVDYAVNKCGMKSDEFMDLFIKSNLAFQFERGAPRVISGISGTELVGEVLWQFGKGQDLPEPQIEYDYSAEYWCGWILVYYQWHTGRSFKDILENVSMAEIEKLYPALHEAPEEKFVDVMNSRMQNQDFLKASR